MNNSKLTVTVRNKVPQIAFGDYLVSDNKQLRIVFDLDSEWNAFAHKTARFIMDGWQFDVAFTGDTVTLPLLPAYTGELRVGLFAGDLSTTTAVSIPVRDSVRADSGAISLDDAAEMARVAAEADRVDAESARAAAEAARQVAEYTRSCNEDMRVESENLRADAERTRSRNEAGRQSAESARSAAESSRQSAESARSAAENARVGAESTRELAEYRRNLAEQARQSAEGARSTAESARAQAEAARANAESLRALAEQARASAEDERVGNESRRASAESARISAESARISHEDARADAEAARQQNEALRIQNELDRTAAELLREQRVDGIIEDFSDYMQHNDVFDVLALIREYGIKAALRVFLNANAPLIGLDAALLRFFSAAAATVSETYTSTFYLYDVSPSPVGSKKDANENLVCIPSTNNTAGRDDYAELPLFACFDCNYTIDGATLEPIVHAIKDVYGVYSPAPADSLVGVLQMSGWVRRTTDSTTKTVEYAAFRKDAGFKPLPEAVRASDNSIRPFVIHAKYAAGYNAGNMLSSVSGVLPITSRPTEGGGASITHDTQITLWREWGDQYSASSLCDSAFLQTMFEIKYANLGSTNVMKGCRSYDLAYKAAVSESGVKRIIVTPAQAANFVVGSSVSLGTSSERNSADCYCVCPIARIASISAITLDSENYASINMDADSSFNTLAGETYIVTQPWFTGSTDAVRGNDGSPIDNMDGKEPFKLQGVELMLGADEVLGDTVFYNIKGAGQPYRVYTNRLAANLSSGGAGSEAARLLPDIIKCEGTAGYRFIKECEWGADSLERSVLPGALGASSSTGCCAALYQVSYSTNSGYLSCIARGKLNDGANAGLVSLVANRFLTTGTALTTCRACGSGANRGIYTENAGTIG